MKAKEIDFEIFNDVFYYDESSASCLRWKVNTYSGKASSKVNTLAGDCAGTFDTKSSCYKVTFKGKVYLVSRVVYCLINKSIDSNKVIDHLDGDRSNNKADNLRLTNVATNARNRKKRFDNKSSKTGVYFISEVRENKTYQYWQARWIKPNGKHGTKQFSINKYGSELAFKLASEHRDNAIKGLNLKGFDYSIRHGL